MPFLLEKGIIISEATEAMASWSFLLYVCCGRRADFKEKIIYFLLFYLDLQNQDS